jgi:secreted PhoX family phosphatase
VVDNVNNRVEKFDSNGTYLSEFGSCGTRPGQFNYDANAIAIDSSGNLWVLDDGEYNDTRVQEFNSNGVYQRQFGSAGTGTGQFRKPRAIAIDTSGNIWVADRGRVQEFNGNGVYPRQFIPHFADAGHGFSFDPRFGSFHPVAGLTSAPRC